MGRARMIKKALIANRGVPAVRIDSRGAFYNLF